MALNPDILDQFLAAGSWQEYADDNIFGENFPQELLKELAENYKNNPKDPNKIDGLGIIPLALSVAAWGVEGADTLPADPDNRGWKGTTGTGNGKHLMSYAKGGIGIPHADSSFLQKIFDYLLANHEDLEPQGARFFALKGINFDILYANGGHCNNPVTTIREDLNDVPFLHAVSGYAGSNYCGIYEPKANTNEEDWRIFRHWLRAALRKKDVQQFIIERWIRKYWRPSYDGTMKAGGTVGEAMINARIRNSGSGKANPVVGKTIDEQLEQAYKKYENRRWGIMKRSVAIYEHFAS